MPETPFTTESPSKKQLEELKKTIEKLGSKKEHEKREAQARLDALGMNKLDVLLAVLENERTLRRKNRRCSMIGLSIYLAIGVLLLIIPPMFGKKPETQFLTQMGSMVAVFGGMWAATNAQKNAMRELNQFDDKRVIGAWATALEFDDKEIVATAREKLIRLLPQLNASDAALLDDEQRAILYKALNKHPNRRDPSTDLHQAILKALQQVGDEKALPHVEKLAHGEGLAYSFPVLRESALECLPYLRERVDRLRASQTLLRASSASEAPASGSNILLRPALDAGATPAEELLRASDMVTQQQMNARRDISTTFSSVEEPTSLLQNRNT